MTVVNGYLQVEPSGAGKKFDTSELVVSAETVERERDNISDPQSNTHVKVADFTENIDSGLLLRGIYNKEIASAFWLLADEVHKLRLAMENEDSSL
jgi:hypothetical protein